MAAIIDGPRDAVAGIWDGATVMIGGFGAAGQPVELIEALLAAGASDLTVVNNNAGNGDRGLAALIGAGRVRKVICSFPRQSDSWHFDAKYRAGEIELELVAQGNLAERIRAAGAGIGAFYTPTGFGTPLADGKEQRTINGRPDDIPAVGGAMDLTLGAKQTFVMMRLLARDGSAKLVRECTYPLTGVGCVSRVYTDLAVFLIDERGVTLRELFGIAPDRLQDLLDIPLVDGTLPSEGPEVTLEGSTS